MSLFANPREHAANPPETWKVVKVGPNAWNLRTADGGTLNSYRTRREAEENKHAGFFVELYTDEARWYAGETVCGWRPYVSLAGETETGQ